MHPLERMRYLSRSAGAIDAFVASEAAEALVQVARVDPLGLLTACRRLIDHHPGSGLAWWLSARMLAAPDPAAAASRALGELDADLTGITLADSLPEEATVALVGWPELVALALRRRGDAEALIVDAGEGGVLARALAEVGTAVTVVPDRGMGVAARVADLAVIEALAAGPDGILAATGSLPLASSAVAAGVPVWGVLGAGRLLPAELWAALGHRLDRSGLEPWDRDVEIVPSSLLGAVVSGEAVAHPAGALAIPSCVAVAELL